MGLAVELIRNWDKLFGPALPITAPPTQVTQVQNANPVVNANSVVNVNVPPATIAGEVSIAACLPPLNLASPAPRRELEELARSDPSMLSNALVESASRGNVECVRRLLKSGAPPNGVAVASDGQVPAQTPVVAAIQSSSVSALKELLDNGADPNLRALATADAGVPPLLAAAERSTDAVKLLLEYGANIDVANEDGETALHAAAARGNLILVKLLVERGAQQDLRERHGNATPADVAAARGHTAVAAWLSGSQPEPTRQAGASAPKPPGGRGRWVIAAGQPDPVGASRTLRSIVDRELNSGSGDDGPPLRMTIDMEGSERIPAPGESRSYDVRITFAGAPGGECVTSITHEERRFGATDPTFSESDLSATSAAIARSAGRYVASRGKDCA